MCYMAQGLFIFYRFVKRKTLPSMEALPVVVLTDPISTGAFLVDIVLSRGFGVLVLWSKERAESLPISHKGVYKAVKEQVSIPETVKAIKGALSPGSAIIACIPGSESGVNLADLISIWLGLLANGSGNRPFPAGDRRNKHLQSSVLKGIAGCRAIREVCGCAWEEVRDSCRNWGFLWWWSRCSLEGRMESNFATPWRQ